MTTTSRALVSPPHAFALLSRGIETLAAPLALTLGPGKGVIINERTRKEIEILIDSSTIARRVIRLPDRRQNLGAMLLRNMALELHERFGDGVATATVMVRAMLQEAARRMAAGANPVILTRSIRRAVDAAQTSLAEQARPVTQLEELVALATSVTGNSELGEVLGQMFEVLGECATVITQDIPRPGLDHEYIRGGKWDGYIPARQIIPEGETGLILHNPLILLADEELTTGEQVQPILELALADPEKPPLLILARSISDAALAMLTANHVRGVLTIGMLVLSSGIGLVHNDLVDIAVLTGGQVHSEVTGMLVHNVQSQACGRAQRVILTENGVTIADGAGTARAVQQRIAEVRAELRQVSRGENSNWDFLRVRLARLAGGIGVLKLGAHTEQELELRKAQTNKALRVLESAYDGGVLPGGGVGFLACLPAINCLCARSQSNDELSGIAIVEAALKAPFLQIVRNHGEIHPPLALDNVLRLGPGYGFDALHGDYAVMEDRHILDCRTTAQGALESAASLAIMLMTTDTIVFSS
ncbi:MAG TPA: TCP-1/cpn60 chaperonin family protein [Ktedonobacteraceae bacterium]|nr:TCP-1/cpn60 chaperonin family protein [Ktedonobacteraceae bacterium]